MNNITVINVNNNNKYIVMIIATRWVRVGLDRDDETQLTGNESVARLELNRMEREKVRERK